MTSKIITIDGPAASGKSSVSRELARILGWKWVSTGAFYRGLAYVALQEGKLLPDTDAKKLAELAHSNVWEVRLDEDQTRVFYKGQDVTAEVLSEQNGTRASLISQIPEVRQALLQNQRNCAVNVTGLVAEGRDCGTVVFPQAMLKLYLTASQEERARRRAKEQGLDFIETQKEQTKRDHQDSSRAAAPLAIPEGARVVDSGGLNLAQTVDMIHGWVVESMANSF